MISHRHKLIFIHIPKCAGTSIEIALDLTPPDAPFGYQDHRTLVDHQPTSWKHLFSRTGINSYLRKRKYRRHPNPSVNVAVDEQQFQEYIKFAVIRDPWSRVLSFYKSKKDASGDSNVDPHSKKLDFYRFLQTNLGRGFLKSQLHWLQEVDGSLGVDTLLRFDSLQADWSSFMKDLGIELKLPHALHRKASTEHDLFTDKAALLVEQNYSAEIDRFNFQYPY